MASNSEVPRGAASLMGLFQPPSPDKAVVEERKKPTETSTLLGLFDPPPDDTPPRDSTDHISDSRPELGSRQATEPRSNKLRFADHLQHRQRQITPPQTNNNLQYNDATPQTTNAVKRQYESIPPAPSVAPPPLRHRRMNSISEDFPDDSVRHRIFDFLLLSRTKFTKFRREYLKTSTFIGSFIFLLYHIVFCLAVGSTILRPHSAKSTLAPMAKMAAAGVIFVSPIFVFRLSKEIPAQYPTTDLFLAPFLAKLAAIVDETLFNDDSVPTEDNDVIFLATFAVLTSLSMFLTGCLLILSNTFKLANLGAFLPFPVLCGFFSAVGVLLWNLAFAVDTGGQKFSALIMTADWQGLSNALAHHIPSLTAGIVMKVYGPRNPFFGTLTVLGLILSTYVVMLFSGTSLQQAKHDGWFWTDAEILFEKHAAIGFERWLPPAPFGVFNAVVRGQVHWGAVYNGWQTVLALGFLYLLRLSLHAAAMKKNVVNLKRIVAARDLKTGSSPKGGATHRRRFTEDLDIELPQPTGNDSAPIMVTAKSPSISLQSLLCTYSWGQFVAAAVGSFGVTPAIAAMSSMYSLGAEGQAPQYGSLLFLLVFYLTDFILVSYIPKMAFSCLIVVSFLDMLSTWFVESYFKTKNKTEWLAVPIILGCAFFVGLLSAVFVGVAISTFLFVAAFFRTGVVKYLANGLTIRSTIERTFDGANWLDQYGDQIQVVVLQNYLFFGNASSMLHYISSMFEEPEEDMLDFALPPLPKYVILDLTLVTGMDTSTVDVFSDIKNLCMTQGCKLYIAGLSPSLRSTMMLGNFKPETGDRSRRNVRFFSDLDAAIGKAEDSLLLDCMPTIEMDRLPEISPQAGFQHALRSIDEQHGTDVAHDLLELYKYTAHFELKPREHLYACDGGQVKDCERGLFFIESGLLKIERDSNMSVTRGNQNSLSNYDVANSLTGLQARVGLMAKEAAMLKAGAARRYNTDASIRLARVGPGWVLGTLEGVGATQFPSHQIAVTKCRVHHLPFHRIEELEEKEPQLILRLYKLLSYLMARRQEITIGQLVTLHSIMTSPAPTKPIGRCSSQQSLVE